MIEHRGYMASMKIFGWGGLGAREEHVMVFWYWILMSKNKHCRQRGNHTFQVRTTEGVELSCWKERIL